VGIGFIDFVSVIGNMFDGEVNGACDRYNSFNAVDLRVTRSLFLFKLLKHILNHDHIGFLYLYFLLTNHGG
jgi:hypothetical protein